MLRPGVGAELTQALMGGFEDRKLLDPCASAFDFIERYGITIDGRPYDFHAYEHMADVFADEHPDQVLMAGAQSGKTALLMVRLLRAAITNWGAMFGWYFPDDTLAGNFSAERFLPLVASSALLRPWLGKRAEGESGTNRVRTRAFGKSTFFFLSVKGKTATEGLPLKGVFFDEVRRMSPGDIQRAEERTSAQVEPFTVKVSTARYPNSDIHEAFMAGDQRYFHTACDCPNGVVLSLTYPDCIAVASSWTPRFRAEVEHAYSSAGLPYLGMSANDLAKYGEAVFLCPRCSKVIVNPRDGWWEEHNPGAWTHSWQLPQMLSPAYSAARCYWKANQPAKAVDIQEIWNSMLGLPYLDADARPVQIEHLRSCVTLEAMWAARYTEAWRRKHMRNTALGLDAQGGYNVIVIKTVQPNGKYRTVHLEIAHGDDPWKRTAELMVEYDVRVAVIDGEPHWNEAHRFAKAFEGRVWLKVYTGGKSAPMVDWRDRAKSPAGQRAAGEEAKFKWMVHIHRTKGLQWSLARWKARKNETPDPTGLMQRLPVQGGRVILTAGLRVGRMEAVPICRDVYWVHQQAVAFRKDYPGEGERKEEAIRNNDYEVTADHVGLDPHFAHADLYANIACSRIGRAMISR